MTFDCNRQFYSGEGLKKIDNVDIGTACISNYMGNPYRAEVVSKKNADTVELLFVDYGNSDIVSTNELFALPPDAEYSTWPRLAFPIKFNVDLNSSQLKKIETFFHEGLVF